MQAIRFIAQIFFTHLAGFLPGDGGAGIQTAGLDRLGRFMRSVPAQNHGDPEDLGLPDNPPPEIIIHYIVQGAVKFSGIEIDVPFPESGFLVNPPSEVQLPAEEPWHHGLAYQMRILINDYPVPADKADIVTHREIYYGQTN